MATHSRFLPGKSHGWRSPVGYSPWGSPDRNTGVGYHFLLQGISPTQGRSPDLLQLGTKGDQGILLDSPRNGVVFAFSLPNKALEIQSKLMVEDIGKISEYTMSYKF